MHAAGIELNDTILVRQSAQTDAVVVGIILRPGDDLHDGIQRVAAAGEHGVAAIEIVVAVVGADDDRLLGQRTCRRSAFARLVLRLQIER